MASVAELTERSARLPATAAVTYLNTGSAGPLLASAADAMSSSLQHELESGRADNTSWELFLDSRRTLRTALGELIGGSPHEMVLTHHTTEGLNLVLWGMTWNPGDRILITSLEHDAGIAAVHSVARRHELVVDVVDCGNGEGEIVLDALAQALTTPARLLVTSHVAWNTGAVLPVRRMTRLAHTQGTAVLVDGAQAVGAVSVDVAVLGVDFYSFNGYKWLCGPEGSGGLFVREDWHDDLLPSHGGAFGVEASTLRIDDVHSAAPAEGAARYESGSWFRPQLPGLLAAAEWALALAASGGGPTQVNAMAGLCARRLTQALGAVVYTPAAREGARSGIVTFDVDGLDPRETVDALEARGVIIRRVPRSDHLRVSCAAFTLDDDIEILLDELSRLRPTTTRLRTAR